MLHRAILLAAFSVAPLSGAAISFEVPEGTVVECRTVPAAGLLERRSPVLFEWVPSTGSRLECDAPGFEPVDVTPASIAPEAPVSMIAALPLTLKFVDREAFEVEWVELAAGHRARVVARRGFESAASISIPVRSETTRLLRIHRRGAAPFTFAVEPPSASEVARDPVSVPDRRQGGELAGRFEEAAFMPRMVSLRKSLERSGGDVRIPVDRDGFFSLSGIAAGAALLSAEFEGGFSKPLGSVSIKAEQTEERYALAFPDVAALDATLATPPCDGGSAFVLTLISGGTSIFRSEPTPECIWSLEGIPSGAPLLLLVTENAAGSSIASHELELPKGRRDSLFLEESAVMVSGSVTFGSADPASGIELRFEKEPFTRIVRTEADGTFEARLEAPGRWSIGLLLDDGVNRIIGLPVESRELVRGDNEVDIELPPGRIVVEVKTEDASAGAHAQLQVRGPKPLTFPAAILDPIRLIALPVGDYELRASIPGFGTSRPVPVGLTESSPEQTVTLLVERKEIRIVIAADGAPLESATINMSAEKVGPGEFVVRQDGGGVFVARAPGFEPQCATLTAPLTRVELLSQGPHVASFSFASLPEGPFGVSARGFRGPSCPVDLQGMIRWRDQRLEIHGLYPGAYELLIAGRVVPFVVPSGTIDVKSAPEPAAVGR